MSRSDKPSNESISFRVAILLVSGVGAAVAGTNLGYYKRITDEGADCNVVSNSEANTAWWVNLIALIIFVIIFIWAMISGPMSINRRKRMEDDRARDFLRNKHLPFDAENIGLPLAPPHKTVADVDGHRFTDVRLRSPPGYEMDSYHSRGAVVVTDDRFRSHKGAVVEFPSIS